MRHLSRKSLLLSLTPARSAAARGIRIPRLGVAELLFRPFQNGRSVIVTLFDELKSGPILQVDRFGLRLDIWMGVETAVRFEIPIPYL